MYFFQNQLPVVRKPRRVKSTPGFCHKQRVGKHVKGGIHQLLTLTAWGWLNTSLTILCQMQSIIVETQTVHQMVPGVIQLMQVKGGNTVMFPTVEMVSILIVTTTHSFHYIQPA